jgi:hypothetical protein
VRQKPGFVFAPAKFSGIFAAEIRSTHTHCGKHSFRIHVAEWRFMTT